LKDEHQLNSNVLNAAETELMFFHRLQNRDQN